MDWTECDLPGGCDWDNSSSLKEILNWMKWQFKTDATGDKNTCSIKFYIFIFQFYLIYISFAHTTIFMWFKPNAELYCIL